MGIRQEWRTWLAYAAALLAGAWLAIVLLALAGSPAWGYDYAAYHGAAQRLVETGSPYQAETLSGPFQPGPFGLYLYSPVPALLLTPLLGAGLGGATWLFALLKMGLLVATCALMPVPRRTRALVFAVACLSLPVLRDLVLGNVSLVVTLAAVVGWRFLDRPVGSAAIAAALALRPTFALLLLWWAIRGAWRPLAWALAAGALLIGLSLPFVGLAGWVDYATVLRNLGDFDGVTRNLALGHVVAQLGAPAWLALLTALLSYGLAAGAMVLSLRRDRELSYVVTLGATLLLSPLLWDHYLVQLLVPAAFMAGRGHSWALALPLACWLPPEGALSLIVVVAMLLPFLAADRGERAGSLLERWPIRRTVQPA